ncbi:MAG: hypothetical protein HY896_02215 [Deltaproteobacteria bacterium]|nr:hypothetical protein [Deltaproteobacteria bacterium]
MKRNIGIYFLSGICMMFLAAALPGTASSITVQNYSFETPVYSDGGGGISGAIDGWIGARSSGGEWSISSIRNPYATDYTSAYDGSQVAFSRSNVMDTVGFVSSFYQDLGDVLTANTTYRLRVDIGNPGSASFGGYTVQLMTVEGNSVLVQDINTLAPADKQFLISDIFYTALASDTNLGRHLRINLISLGSQTDFDNVRLDAAPVPIPNVAWLFSSGVVTLFGLKRRRPKL